LSRTGRQRQTFWLTIGLGLAAFLPFALVFLESSGRDNAPLVLDEGAPEALEDGLRMLSPSFTGRTPNGEPYVVTADWALPDAPNPNRIKLRGVEATMTLADGRIATLLAADGAFFPQIKRLRIENGVAVTTSDGYRVDTNAATVDADGRSLRTDGAVRATGPTGSIQADLLEALDAEDRIVKFSGNVLVLIKPEQARNDTGQP
jgi:lipopolysaccharide export system protein LptC